MGFTAEGVFERGPLCSFSSSQSAKKAGSSAATEQQADQVFPSVHSAANQMKHVCDKYIYVHDVIINLFFTATKKALVALINI